MHGSSNAGAAGTPEHDPPPASEIDTTPEAMHGTETNDARS
jgi:hypothetical protein